MNSVHLDQSAALYTYYYYAVMLLHRPFLAQKPASTNPDMRICTDAAQACARLAVQHARRSVFIAPHMHYTFFMSAVLLMINVWASRVEAPHVDVQELVDDIGRCLEALRAAEHRYAPLSPAPRKS